MNNDQKHRLALIRRGKILPSPFRPGELRAEMEGRRARQWLALALVATFGWVGVLSAVWVQEKAPAVKFGALATGGSP